MALFDTFGKTSVMRGMSYVNNYDQDVQNAIRMNQLKMERQNQREQKARYYAERLKEGVAHDELNSKRLEAYYDKLNAELGDFIMSAPKNWEQNILYQKQFNQIADKYLNNGILAESERVKMEMQKMYQDKNMTPDFLERNMKEYEIYKNQEFDPENPDAELNHKFLYNMRPTIGIDQAVANVAKNMGLVKKTRIGEKYFWEVQNATDEQINVAASQLLTNPEYKYSLDVAWNNYQNAKNENSQLNIYKDRLEFAKALVQNTVPVQEIMRDINPAYEFGLKQQLEKTKAGLKGSGGISVPSKAWNTMQELSEKGEVFGQSDLLAYANIDANGIISWNPNQSSEKAIAYINGYGDIGKLNIAGNKLVGSEGEERSLQGVNHMIIEEGQTRMFIDPSTGRPMIQATATIPMTAEDAKLMQDLGFREVSPETTAFAIQSGKSLSLGFDKKKKYMMGTVYLPADLTNYNNHWEYMDWGFDQKSRTQFVESQHVPTLSKIAGQTWYGWKFDKEGNRIDNQKENQTKTNTGEYTEDVKAGLDYFTQQ